LAGCAAIATGQAGAASRFSLFQGLCSHCDITAMSGPDWSDHISTASTAPLPTVCSHLCASFLGKSSDLGNAFLHQVPSSDHSRVNCQDISIIFQTTPNPDPTLWRTGRLSRGEYTNTSSPLKVNQSGKLPETWMRQLTSQNYISNHLGGDSLTWTQNITE
jgi:hypothetical protein